MTVQQISIEYARRKISETAELMAIYPNQKEALQGVIDAWISVIKAVEGKNTTV